MTNRILCTLLVFAALAHSSVARQDSPREWRLGEPLSIELAAADPILDGHGPSQVVHARSPIAGVVNVWIESTACDPWLRVEDERGKLLAQDGDSGGGTTPRASFQVEAEQSFTLRIAATKPGETGHVEVHASLSPETVATRAADAKAARETKEIDALRKTDAAAARERVRALVDELDAVEGADQSALITEQRWTLGGVAYSVGDLVSTDRCWRKVLAWRERSLPATDSGVQKARTNVGAACLFLGDAHAARELLEQSLEMEERLLPETDLELNRTRQTLAMALQRLGDADGELALYERALAALERTVPDDEPRLQTARMNAGSARMFRGNLQGARPLLEAAVEGFEANPGENELNLPGARTNLSICLFKLGELEPALELQQAALDVYLRILPGESTDVLRARTHMARVLCALGRNDEALTFAREALAAVESKRPDGDPDVVIARMQLAAQFALAGDHVTARALLQRSVDGLVQRDPVDERLLCLTRAALGETLRLLGDLPAARELEEQALETALRLFPEDSQDLMNVRTNLANTLSDQNELEAARAVYEQVYEVTSRTRPEGDWHAEVARMNLAASFAEVGDLPAALRLCEKSLAALENHQPPSPELLETARQNVAQMRFDSGDHESSYVLQRQVVEARSKLLPRDNTLLLSARHSLVLMSVVAGRRDECERAASSYASELENAIRRAASTEAPRQLEERIAQSKSGVSSLLNVAGGSEWIAALPTLDAPVFELVETLRSAPLATSRVLRAEAVDPELASLRARARDATSRIVALASTSATEPGLAQAVLTRDRAQEDLLARLRTCVDARALELEPDAAKLSAHLRADQAAVGFWRYSHWRKDPDSKMEATATDELLAFVLRPGAPLVRVELGPVSAIEQLVKRWRAAMLAPPANDARAMERQTVERRESGEALRRVVLDPLLGSLGDAKEVALALDDPLHLIALDALPLGEGSVGDRLRLSVRTTLCELALEDEPASGPARLLAVGGIDYDESPPSFESLAGEHTIDAADPDGATGLVASAAMRSAGPAGRYAPLDGTRREVNAIAELFAQCFKSDSEALVLSGRDATRSELVARAHDARFLHLATHGSFASQSIAALDDPPRARAATRWLSPSVAQRGVRGLSPMVLCGLALSGANQAADELDATAGVITAEELSALDLRHCELAVLSACDTNVGERRTGRGVASLQRALHMAGVRTVVTSLWKVPDEATRELMLGFYRGIWIEHRSKADALWRAKQALRAKRLPMRDWAGWVLSGNPD